MRSFGKHPTNNSHVFALQAKTLQEAAARLSVPDKYFTVLIACDLCDLPPKEVADFAAALMEKGAVYVCCWGKNCERFHDIIDEVWVARETAGEYGAVAKDSTLMTTWHQNESLDEALWYLLFCAWPQGDDSQFYSTLAITVGNEGWAELVSRRLANIPQLDAEMVERD